MARRKTPETDAALDPSAEAPEGATSTEETAAPAVDALVAPQPSDVPPLSPPVVSVPQQGPSFLGPVLGGALAAVAGFALSHFNAFGLTGPDNSAALTDLSNRLAAIEAAPSPEATDLTGLETSLTALEGRIAALEEAPAPPLPDLSALDSLDRRLAAIEAMPTSGGDASTAALAAKLAELERRLSSLPAEGVDTAEVEAALARLEAAEAEAAARATAAAEAAAAAERALALDRLRAAAESGPFEVELQALGDADLTASLSPHQAGVATVEELQADFPDLVREALTVIRAADGEGGWSARVVDFLAAQTGARPLIPQDGSTPDAILSRADFAVTEGRLDDALTELAALPPDIQALFADWSARATARLAVNTALGGQ